MIVSVTERGTTDLTAEAWTVLSRDARFWRLVQENIVRPEATNAGRWRLRGTCYVGRAVFDSIVLEITEKFVGAFEILARLGIPTAPKVTRTPSPVAPSPGSTTLLISLFILATRTYLSGFKKVAYTRVPNAGAIISGRLDVIRTARLRASGAFHRAAFDRTVLTADLPINRCIYAALREVERLARTAQVAPHDLASARALRLGLSECLPSVLKMRRGDLATLAEREAIRPHPHPQIADVISLAGAVLDAAGFGGLDNWKRTVERSWFVNMETFFEDAVRHAVANALAGSAAVTGPQHRPSLFDPPTGRYRANPDIVVRQASSLLAIGDAKYKDFSDWPSTQDVHEIIAHAAAYQAPAALLFYPDEHGFSVRDFGRASTGCQLWAFGLDFRDFLGSVERAVRIAQLSPR